MLRNLRKQSRFVRMHEDVIFSVVNLFVFIFVITAVVYVSQVHINDDINDYIDALYFTIATLTTTGFGDITLVEMPGVGDEIKAGEAMGTVESVKAVSDMFAPISGTVNAVNEELDDAPEKVNEDCYGAGWMLSIKISDPAEVEALFDNAGYKDHLSTIDD